MALFNTGAEERDPLDTGVGPARFSLSRAIIARARERRLDRSWNTKGTDVLVARERMDVLGARDDERVTPFRGTEDTMAATTGETEGAAKERAVEIQRSSEETGLTERAETEEETTE